MFYNLVRQTRAAFKNRIVAGLSAFVTINGLSILVYTLGMRGAWVAATGYGLITLAALLTLLLVAAVIERSVGLREGWMAEVGLVVSAVNVVIFLEPRFLGPGMWLPAVFLIGGAVAMSWQTLSRRQARFGATSGSRGRRAA